jgi:hypothetical protein
MEGRVGTDHTSAGDGVMLDLARRALVASAFTVALMLATVSASRQTAQAPCSEPEYHQFDFLLGDWNAYDVGRPTLKARNSVTRMLDGCAVREVYRRLDGYVGESISIYDVARRTWHQSWATNRGELLLLDGGMTSGAMVLIAHEAPVNGLAPLLRGVWRQQRDGSVRETADRSTDGGAHWAPVFDIEFRHAASPVTKAP